MKEEIIIDGQICAIASDEIFASNPGRRVLLGWSQDKLARRSGIGLATLRRIEQTGRNGEGKCFKYPQNTESS